MKTAQEVLYVSISVFTARRVCIARTMPLQDVRLSVTRRYSVKMVIRILKFFSPLNSPTILVFPHQTGWQYSDGDPHNRGIEYKGV